MVGFNREDVGVCTVSYKKKKLKKYAIRVIEGAERPSMDVFSPRGKTNITLTANRAMETGHVFSYPCTLTNTIHACVYHRLLTTV